MKLTRILDDLLSSQGKVRLLRELLRHPGHAMSGRRLAKLTSLSASQAHLLLQELHQSKVVDLDYLGKSHVYAIRLESLLVREILAPLFKSERTLIDAGVKVIWSEVKVKMKREPFSTYLFGSVSRGEDHAESDLDLAFVVRTAREKARLDNLLLGELADSSESLGITLGAIVLTLREARARYKQGDPFIREVFMNGRRVYGEFMLDHLVK